MTPDTKPERPHLTCAAERMYPDVDPALVWALVADPERAGEWAAVTTVGYMGTELPEVGQAVFVRTARWQPPSRARRVEVESWNAGSGYTCRVTGAPLVDAIEFSARVEPVVGAARLSTRVRVVLRAAPARLIAGLWGWFARRRVEHMLDRIERRARA